MNDTAPQTQQANSEQKQGVRQGFDSDAIRYAKERATQYSFLAQKAIVLNMLGTTKGNVLDVGCGSGAVQHDLLERGLHVWGIDISHEMIAHAYENTPEAGQDRVRLSVGDIEKLHFPDGFFDAIVCLGVFEYLLTYDNAIAEIRRTLKPGGVAIITVPSRVSAYRLVARVAKPVFRLLKKIMGKPSTIDSFDIRQCVPWRLDRQLGNADLIATDRAHSNFIFFPLLELCPGLSKKLSQGLQRFERSRLLGWMGNQYIVMCVRKP